MKSSTRKQVILLKTLAKQRNAISMGFVKQKSSPIDSYKKQHIPGSKYYCLKHCRNSTMLFQWVCETRILSCRKCSEDSKTFRGLKIGPLLRELWAKMCFGTKS